MYETTPTPTPVINPVPSKPKINLPPQIFNIIKIITATVVVGAIAAFASGFVSSFITTYFDPTTVLTYIVIAYLLGNYHHLTNHQAYICFIASLILAFTVPLLAGSIFLVLIIPTLRLLKVLPKATA